jgi:hypothetical protein
MATLALYSYTSSPRLQHENGDRFLKSWESERVTLDIGGKSRIRASNVAEETGIRTKKMQPNGYSSQESGHEGGVPMLAGHVHIVLCKC